MFNKIAILGVGLIGASFGLAVKKQGLCREIVGYGRSPVNLGHAMKKGAIDSGTDDPSAACEGADLIMLSTPVGTFTDLVLRVAHVIKTGAIVTDAGSVKGDLVYDLESAMPEGAHYVGAHPIAGSELSGAAAAYSGLFSGAKCIVTPTSHSGAEALARVTALWEKLGAIVTVMDPREHDRVYAAVSHLPHLIAYTMVNTVADIDRAYLEMAGQGFRDMTRIAGSSPELWRDISLMNRRNLVEMIEVFRRHLDSLSSYLGKEEGGLLEGELRRAQELRNGLGQN
ncbi:MAG: prephenate dehydrogenase/arogenate dehydrogenase family protein [Nitrospiraceae bacterium]|nr:prephenate dehydrogenase/arogenate dehydrogenase family protein [Nitrospiraceae bacterium]